MSTAAEMRVTLRLPTRTLFDGHAIKMTVVAKNGALGILPNHVDFVTALVPSVLTLTTPSEEELIFGIDAGLLVKRGHAVDIAIRRGVQGSSLDTLHETVTSTFIRVDEEERLARTALSRLEANIVRHFGSLRAPQR